MHLGGPQKHSKKTGGIGNQRNNYLDQRLSILAKIPRRVLEICGDLLLLRLLWKTPANTGMKKSQGVKWY